jgi:UDPglucose 6-dehydrogenase
MNIAVIGCGYVGLAAAITLALMKHKVVGVDIDKTKVDKLNNKQPTLYERGLPEALKQTVESGNLEFTTELGRAIKACDYCSPFGGIPGNWKHLPESLLATSSSPSFGGKRKWGKTSPSGIG